MADDNFIVITPKEKDILQLPDYGLGWFLIPDRIEISLVYNHLILIGKAYEIDQETGEPVFQGRYQANISLETQNIYDMEEFEECLN